MAIKKSDLYASIWASCDELRGGMDASQYKDYVLFLLFIKYVSDKYRDSDEFAPPVTIPKGASFKDMIALKGKSDIGDKINTQVIAPLVNANSRLARSDFPDFNDSNKLGEGPAKVERLSNLVAIFQKPELDFSKNRADNDDILGEAYEYLMRLSTPERSCIGSPERKYISDSGKKVPPNWGPFRNTSGLEELSGGRV
jgi:type I restriction enzyme M protein